MCMLDLDMGESETKKLSVADSKSTLAKPVKELITMIFDIESMKAAMLEFEIDLTKMPLGRLSKTQIKQAGLYVFSILNSAYRKVQKKSYKVSILKFSPDS